MTIMNVTKRTGQVEEVSFDKVLNRIQNLTDELDVNSFEIAQKVCSRIYDGVKTSELDELAAQLCRYFVRPSFSRMKNPDFFFQ